MLLLVCGHDQHELLFAPSPCVEKTLSFAEIAEGVNTLSSVLVYENPVRYPSRRVIHSP